MYDIILKYSLYLIINIFKILYITIKIFNFNYLAFCKFYFDKIYQIYYIIFVINFF